MIHVNEYTTLVNNAQREIPWGLTAPHTPLQLMDCAAQNLCTLASCAFQPLCIPGGCVCWNALPWRTGRGEFVEIEIVQD